MVERPARQASLQSNQFHPNQKDYLAPIRTSQEDELIARTTELRRDMTELQAQLKVVEQSKISNAA